MSCQYLTLLSRCIDHRTIVLAHCIHRNMRAVNVPLFISFGFCTNIIASSQFAIQQWKLELSVNEFCNTASWLSLPKVLLDTAKTQQYNNGADGACLRRDINCSFLQGVKLPLSLYFKSPLSCWPKSLRVTILDPLYFFSNYKAYITPHWSGLLIKRA